MFSRIVKELGWKSIPLLVLVVMVLPLATFGAVDLFHYCWRVRPLLKECCGDRPDCSAIAAPGGLIVATEFEKGQVYHWAIFADGVNLALITPMGQNRREISVAGGLPIGQEVRVVLDGNPPRIGELTLVYGGKDVERIAKDLDYDGVFDLRLSRPEGARVLLNGEWVHARREGEAYTVELPDGRARVEFEHGAWRVVDRSGEWPNPPGEEGP